MMNTPDTSVRTSTATTTHLSAASDSFAVVAASLNLRQEPKVRTTNRIAVLPQGHKVRRLRGAAEDGWWRVATSIAGRDFEGFVSSAHLAPADDVHEPAAVREIAAIRLRENWPAVRRDSTAYRAFPIGEPNRPNIAAVELDARPEAFHEAIDWLAVDESARYQRAGASTFPTIYACDFCYLADVYLPRVWWTGPALRRLARGEPTVPRLGETVTELNAHGIFEWLQGFGPEFGWQRALTADECQAAVNEGMVGIIIAQRMVPCDPGHVAVVVPETGEHRARRHNGTVSLPLQSQAGTVNYRRFEGTIAWWLDARYRQYAFWIHEGNGNGTPR